VSFKLCSGSNLEGFAMGKLEHVGVSDDQLVGQNTRGSQARANKDNVSALYNVGSVPVFVSSRPDSGHQNKALRDLLFAKRARQRTETNWTQRGGWHSGKRLAEWTEPEIQALTEWMRCEVNRMLVDGGLLPADATPPIWDIEAWAAISPPEMGYHAAHNHIQKGFQWSGVYYVDDAECGRKDCGGALIIEDRSGVPYYNPKGNAAFPRERRIRPQAGQFVLFPAYTYHRVEKHTGPRDRTAIACNFYSSDFAIDMYPSMVPPPNWRWKHLPGPMLLLKRAERGFRRFLPGRA
ncbi:MAG: putative 2OG-Fe(II) oxygenase, partial [Pseudomonadota bacterium]